MVLMLCRKVRKSNGWGETATDPEILQAIELLAEKEGIFTEPAGGATLASAIKLIRQKRINPPRNNRSSHHWKWV